MLKFHSNDNLQLHQWISCNIKTKRYIIFFNLVLVCTIVLPFFQMQSMHVSWTLIPVALTNETSSNEVSQAINPAVVCFFTAQTQRSAIDAYRVATISECRYRHSKVTSLITKLDFFMLMENRKNGFLWKAFWWNFTTM